MLIKWFEKNYRTIIRISFLIPILVAAVVSVYHVISWYSMTNPLGWAIYLSVGIEIAALSALAGMTARMGKFVYVPFLIVTLIQILGNIFASYQYIDINSVNFKAWVELFNPLFEMFGWVENGDAMTHKRILGILGGAFIPLISLTFLHLLVSFNEKEDSKNEGTTEGTTEGTDPEPTEPIEPEPTEPEPIEPEPTEPEPTEPEPTPVDPDEFETKIKALKEAYSTPVEIESDPIVEGPITEAIIEEGIIEEPIVDELVDEVILEEIIVEEPIEEPLEIVETKKEVVREPVIPTGKISRDEIDEIKNPRNFSVKIPTKKKNNGIERIGSNKVSKGSDIVYKHKG